MAFDLITSCGAPDTKLANHFQVSHTTIKRWKGQHLEFRSKCEAAWDEWNCPLVEKGMLKRATGYRYIEKTIEINPDEGGKRGKPTKITKYHKVMPPDVGAGKFLLTSRRSDRYQDKQKIEHEGNITVQTVDYAKAETKKEDS